MKLIVSTPKNKSGISVFELTYSGAEKSFKYLYTYTNPQFLEHHVQQVLHITRGPQDTRAELRDNAEYMILARRNGIIEVFESFSEKVEHYITCKNQKKVQFEIKPDFILHLSCGENENVVSLNYQSGLLYVVTSEGLVTIFVLNLPPEYHPLVRNQCEASRHVMMPMDNTLREEERDLYSQNLDKFENLTKFTGRTKQKHVCYFLSQEEGFYKPTFHLNLHNFISRVEVNPHDKFSLILCGKNNSMNIIRLILTERNLMVLREHLRNQEKIFNIDLMEEDSEEVLSPPPTHTDISHGDITTLANSFYARPMIGDYNSEILYYKLWAVRRVDSDPIWEVLSAYIEDAEILRWKRYFWPLDFVIITHARPMMLDSRGAAPDITVVGVTKFSTLSVFKPALSKSSVFQVSLPFSSIQKIFHITGSIVLLVHIDGLLLLDYDQVRQAEPFFQTNFDYTKRVDFSLGSLGNCILVPLQVSDTFRMSSSPGKRLHDDGISFLMIFTCGTRFKVAKIEFKQDQHHGKITMENDINMRMGYLDEILALDRDIGRHVKRLHI